MVANVLNLQLGEQISQPTTAVQGFNLAEFPGLQFLHYGTAGGTAVLLHFWTDARARDLGSESYQPPSSLSLDLGFASPTSSRVCHTAWSNNNNRHLLAAVSAGNALHVLSLSGHFHALQGQLTGIEGRLAPSDMTEPGFADPDGFPPSAAHPYEQLASAQMSGKIVAIEWTQAADGLLMADDQGNVTLYHLSWPPASRLSLEDLDAPAVRVKPSLTQAWQGRSSIAVQPQDLITAGACAVAPSASATSGSKTVTVWWPQHVDGATQQAGWAVAEQLRHPAPICGLQWSPGALQKGVSYSSDEEGDDSTADQVGASHPALLTLTVEGTMRIWVEVTMESGTGQSFGPALPVVGTPRESSAPGSAHFCMSLVIDPPEQAFALELGGLRACWGTPLGLATNRGAGQRAAKVMWIVAIGRDSSGGEGERLLLWVLDGLAGVVISAVPNNVVGSKLLSSPRAVLWGEHQGLLSWPPSSGRQGERAGLAQVSCSVGVEEDAPVLHVFESLRSRRSEEAPANLRCYRIDTVDEVVQGRRSPRAGPDGSPRPWNLSLQSFCQHQVSGHGSAITCMAAHPQQPVAASLDREGTVLLWALEPLQLLGPAFGPDQGIGLKHQDSMALLDSSLQQAALPPHALQTVQCAAMCWLGLGEPAQEPLQAVLACAMSDGAVKLLAVRTRATSNSNARLLASLMPPPSHVICPHALRSLQSSSGSATLVALCHPSTPPVEDTALDSPSLLAHWRIPTAVLTRSAAQQRAQPVIIQPSQTWTFADLGLVAPPKHGLLAAATGHNRGRADVEMIAALPGLRMPALLLGGSAGLSILCFPKDQEPGSDRGPPSVHVALHGPCPPAAGKQTALAASSLAGLVAAGFRQDHPHRSSSSGILALWQPLPTSIIQPDASNLHRSPAAETLSPGKVTTSDGAAKGWQLCLVAELGIDSPPTAICWLDHLQAAAPALAVAQGPASLAIYAQLPRSTTGSKDQWACMALLPAAILPVGALAITSTGSLLAGLGSQAASVRPILTSPDSEQEQASGTQMPSACSLAQHLTGDAHVPLHHPAALQRHLLANRRAAAISSVQSLLALLEPPTPPEAPAVDEHQQMAYVPPVRTSQDAAAGLARRSSQNGATALTSPAAAYSNGQHLSVEPGSQPLAPRPGIFVKAADVLDPGLLAWAEEMASDAGNAAAHRIIAWDEENGMDRAPAPQSETNTAQNGHASHAPKQTQQQQAAADPSAFNPAAFGLGSTGSSAQVKSSSQSQPSAPDPGAFDPAAFGMASFGQGDDQADGDHDANGVPPAADPGAFDASAFGFGMPDGQDSDGEEPTVDASNQPAADPGAFDPSAFGFGMSPAQDDGDDEEEEGADSAPKPAVDPGAFDPAAFGFGMPNHSEEDEEAPSARQQQPGAKPAEKASRPVTSKSSKPAADPGAFDLSAFGFGGADTQSGSAQPPQPGDDDSMSSRQASSQHASTSGRLPASAGPALQGKRQTRQMKSRKIRNPAKSRSSTGYLSDDDFTKLQGLTQKLISAQAQEIASSDPDDLEDIAEQARLKKASSEARIGHLPAAQLKQLLALAQLLLKDIGRPDMDLAGLDLPAQQALLGVQVAAISEAVDSKAASDASSPAGHPASNQSAKLMAGLELSSILWALLSGSPVRLLDTCLKVVHVKSEKAAPIQPKIDFTSRGEGRLDLGFGAERKQQGLGKLDSGQRSWPALRACGAGFWLTDATMARTEAEAIAKATYAATRDPSDVALFYMGLGRKPLLQGLLRSSQQVKLADFLNRDFTEARNKEAACKNAFVLLGQHRYDMAAAFFLLGGAQQDAVGVCAKEIEDPQLALFLCHMLEGPQGPLQHHLITTQLLPHAEEIGDAWSICILHWLLGSVGPALSALIPQNSEPGDEQSAPSAFSKPRPADQLLRSIDPALLELLRHCWDEGWLDQLPTSHVQTIALGSAMALQHAGCPLLALEALQVAQISANSQQKASVSSPMQNLLDDVMTGHKTQLAASGLAPSAASTGHQGSTASAHQQTLQQLQALVGAGITVEAQAVEGLIEKLAAALQPSLSQGHRRSMELVTSPSGMSEISQLSRASRRTSQGSQRQLGVVEDGLQLFSIDGDKTHAICASAVGEWVAGAGEGRPIVVASNHHGLVETELLADPLGTQEDTISSAADGKHKGTTFTTMLTGMLEAVRWPPDPWALIAPNQGAAAGATSPRVQAKRAHISTATLCAHPSRPIYISGCSTGEIYLWHFGQRMASAGYTPLPASAPSMPSTSSLFSAPSKAWNPHTPGVSFAQWGQPQAVRFSDCGEHFAAVGEGGVVATWRVDAPRYLTTDTGSLGRAEWCHQGLARKGVDVVYIGGSNTVLAVGGQGVQGANIVLWDTNAHPRAPPVARMTHHSSLVTALQMLPGGQLLASGDETGELAVKDLRMLGQSSSSASKQTVWTRRGGQGTGPGSGISCLAVGPKPSGRLLLASGSRDGQVCLWSPDKGSLQQAVHISSSPPAPVQTRSRAKGFLSDILRPKSHHSPSVVVSGVCLCPDGLLTCSLEGLVHFHKFL